MTSIILDVGTGIDDALAIATAARSSSIDLVACTVVWGNVDVAQGARNTSEVLALAGRDDVPVAVGAAGPYDGRDAWYSPQVHGADGQGGHADLAFAPTLSERTAVETIVAASHAVADLELVAVGPLTNLAHALDADPTLPERIRQVTIMGGAVLRRGNVSEFAEANIHHDPEAAAKVFAAPWEVTLVGLDVTMDSIITDEMRQRLAGGDALGQRLAAMLDAYMDFYEPILGQRAAVNHDAVALGIATGLVQTTRSPLATVTVDCSDGPERGRTRAVLEMVDGAWQDEADARHRVVLEVGDGFERAMLDIVENPSTITPTWE
ncbi:nucleoside hydrolase [Agrococcus jejuensis]|uniref:Purine nucleosidase n=1 Tax=Agrococcus jejuensis TaxID=399736 RepID=A0A1G8CQ66_9MICO|nr:nucleoside hydrolase [Agrococcus jejuensis]SDH47552.1 purine nucleosidase [Agrococcus jejuensis]